MGSKTLAEIAGGAGMTIADVAFLAGLDESTVSRLWTEPMWLDRVRGRTLQAIIGAVPGVAELLVDYALARRRRRLIDSLAREGLQVREDIFQYLVTAEGMPEQWVSSALEAALHIMRRDDKKAAACLTRFWGREQDRTLGFLWNADANLGLVKDAEPLLAKSAEMSERLAEHGNSFHAIIARATFVHHIAKTTGLLLRNDDPKTLDRRSVMPYRSGVMGRIIQTGDIEEAQHYSDDVKNNALLFMVESWAFPTFTRDAVVTADFSVPRSLLLRNFASSVIQEIETSNDAYLHYLVSVAIPLMLQRDPTLGLRAGEILTKLKYRIDTGSAVVTEQVAPALLSQLELFDVGRDRGGI
ncbi:hypothetical protein ACIBCN_33180 [Nocardia sp. NPDC051052]|uniref:hypothetical protein n=1 Tax=Nocardia sp. NPDC051052 TaxID=3364322 RepID=UPI0037A5CCE3